MMLYDTQQTSGGYVRTTSSAIEAGDATMVRPSTYNRLMHVPPAANDNGRLPPVIGLMGFGGAGKSETAKILETLGYTRLHVKAPLRAVAAALLREAGISETMIDRYLDGDLKREVIPEMHRTGTELQQFLGTEFGREFCYPALWLDLWTAKARAIIDAGGRVVQESVRFANEAVAIKGLGGVVVRVERVGVGPLSGHVSEAPPAAPDSILYNNGSPFDLHLQVLTWLRHAA